MIRTILTTFAATLLLIGLLARPGSAKPTLDDLAGDILKELQAFYPVRATSMGIHAHDFKLPTILRAR